MSDFDPAAYWERRLRRHAGLDGVGYIGLGGPYNNWLYRVRRRVFRRLMRGIDANLAAAEILDIGCGTGFYVERWKEQGATRITGIDLTEVAVERLRSRFPSDRFLRCDISDESAPTVLGRYDIISAFDVLFHIMDDERYARAMRNISTLLRPGGWLVFSENFHPRETVRFHHGVCRSAREIEGLVEGAGLSIVRRGPMFVLMNPPIDASKRFRNLLWNTCSLPVRANRRIGIVTGFLLGGLLYPIELALTAVMKHGPSTSFAVCRKTRG